MTDTMEHTLNPILIGNRNFKVTFQKANSGEVRTMNCNFFNKPVSNDEALAYVATLEGKDLLTVYDIDAGKWKSFYSSKVISYEVI